MRIINVDFHKPGKGQATYRTTLKDLLKDNCILVSFREKDKIDYATDVTEQSATYIYRDRQQLVFSQDREIFYVDLSILSPIELSLITNAVGELICKILVNREGVLRIILPTTVNIRVEEVNQQVRRADTANPSTYPIRLSGDINVKAPHFINAGDIIVINTEDLSYVRREGNEI